MSDIPRKLIHACSAGEMSRRDVGERLGRYVGFGEVLAALHECGLPLPRYAGAAASAGVLLTKQLAEQAWRAG